MNRVIEIPGAQFEHEMRASTHPMLAHFHTSWTGPSRVLAESLETLAGGLSIRRANLDRRHELAQRYRITDVPTLVLFDHGAQIRGFAGSISPRELKAQLQGLVADYAPQQGNGKQL